MIQGKKMPLNQIKWVNSPKNAYKSEKTVVRGKKSEESMFLASSKNTRRLLWKWTWPSIIPKTIKLCLIWKQDTQKDVYCLL